jgi:hypothetical protein
MNTSLKFTTKAMAIGFALLFSLNSCKEQVEIVPEKQASPFRVEQIPVTCTTPKFNKGQCTAGVALIKGGSVCNETDKNGKVISYITGGVKWSGMAKDWYDNAKKIQDDEIKRSGKSDIDCFTDKSKIVKGTIVVFGSNKASTNGHVGIIVDFIRDAKKNVTGYIMVSMNDLDGEDKYSRRPVSCYPNSKSPSRPIGYINYKTSLIAIPSEYSISTDCKEVCCAKK